MPSSKKLYPPVIIPNKKHLSKQVVPITYALQENILAAAVFEGLCVVF